MNSLTWYSLRFFHDAKIGLLVDEVDHDDAYFDDDEYDHGHDYSDDYERKQYSTKVEYCQDKKYQVDWQSKNVADEIVGGDVVDGCNISERVVGEQ